MNSNNRKILLTLMTDYEGHVYSVLRDDNKLVPENVDNLREIVEQEDYLNLFYNEILSAGFAENSKIKFRNSSLHIQAYGIKLDNQVLMFCSAETVNVYDYIEELAKINAIQTNTIRYQSKLLAEKNKKEELNLLEKLSKLNNDLVKVQRDLFKKNDALKRITDKMNTVFKSAGLAFVFFKQGSVIESFNDAGLQFLFRLTGENLKSGMNLSGLSLDPTAEFPDDLITRILYEDQVVEDIYLDYWFEIRTYPVVDESGSKTGTLLIAENIDRRKKNERTIEDQKELLYLINKILRHDLANVFTVSLSAMSLFKRTSDKTMLDSIVDASNRGIAIIDRMKSTESILDNSKNLYLVSLGSVVSYTMKEFKDMRFTCDGNGEIYGDKMIISMLSNLVSNAKSHGNADEMRFFIRTVDDQIKFVVANNGKPIPENIREKVFEENFSFGQTAHTGLGLYIVKKTAERYKGQVRIETCDDGGPAFVFHFPVPEPVKKTAPST